MPNSLLVVILSLQGSLLLIGILLVCLLIKTRDEVAKYVHYVEKFESEKPVEIRYLVVASSYRECEHK